jgi:hypothetical protein
MTLKQEIQRYLNGEGYYNWGIELLEKLNHDPVELRKLRAFCKDTYAPSWAEQRIMEILKGAKIELSPWQTRHHWTELSNQQNEVSKAIQQQIKNSPDEPEVITVLREEVKIRLKARADWHAQMKATPRAEEKRKAHCAEQIMSLTDELEKRYILLNNWRDNHILPPLISTKVTASDDNAATEIAQIVGDINTIAPRVSKIRGLLKTNLSDNRRAELKKELEEKEAALIVLRAKSVSFRK